MFGLSIIIISTFSILVLSAAVSDLLWFKISNVIPISLSILFFISVVLIDWDIHSVFYNFLTAIVALFVCFIFFNIGFFGGGDAKLISAICIWSGLQGLYEFILIMALIGGVLAIILTGFRKINIPPNLRNIAWINELHGATKQVPYGIAISASALATFHQFPIFEYIINVHLIS
ncbi:MAG: hypothetical protein CMP14_00115 [Rickettsiales bacterium]|nr:hypothetical protein [Rickettsiales bacterium]